MSEQDQKNSKKGPEAVPVQTDEKAYPDVRQTGRVWLVGAGPGAPDLITKRGWDLLREADVVVYDALILPETLEMLPRHTEKIYVGKRAGAHSVPQEEIQEILIREAQAGKQVVRLKGGDPFVFGRGGEEALALAGQGIPCEVVPGVTSAVAVPEAFGIPVTHRGIATSFTVITGHGQTIRENPHSEERTEGTNSAETYRIDYEALVRTGGTLIFLMGLGAADRICRGLMDAGLDPAVPAAALSKGTTPSQRMVLSDVGRLPEEIRNAGLSAPAILVVGDVCALARVLDPWHSGEGSEKGETDLGEMSKDVPTDTAEHPYSRGTVTVVVTRQADRAEAFSEKIRALGMKVCELPAIRIQRPGEAALKEAACALRKLCGEASADGEGRPAPMRVVRMERKCGETPADDEGQEQIRPESGKENQDASAWIVFTSANGVHAFFDLLTDVGMDMRSLFRGSRKYFAVVGQKTAEALKGYGILADLVPEEHTGAALGEALGERIEEENEKNRTVPGKGPGVWYFGAEKTEGGLKTALGARGILLKTVPVYETVSAVKAADADRLAEQMARGEERLIFTFTSASCVRNLAAALREAEAAGDRTPALGKAEAAGDRTSALGKAEAAGDRTSALKKTETSVERASAPEETEAGDGLTNGSRLLRGQVAVCIGARTAKAAREAGMRAVIAEESTEESMLEAVRRAAEI